MVVNRIDKNDLRLIIHLILLFFIIFFCKCQKPTSSLKKEADEYSISLSMMLEELEYNDTISIKEAVDRFVGYTDDTLYTSVIQHDSTGIEFYVEHKNYGTTYHIKDGEISSEETSMAGYIENELDNSSYHKYFDTEEKKEWYDTIKWLIYQHTFFYNEYCKSSYYKRVNYPLLYAYFSKPAIIEREDTILLRVQPFIVHPKNHTPSWCLFEREVKFSSLTGEIFSIEFFHYSESVKNMNFSKNLLYETSLTQNEIDSILKLELLKNKDIMNTWFVKEAKKRGYLDDL